MALNVLALACGKRRSLTTARTTTVSQRVPQPEARPWIKVSVPESCFGQAITSRPYARQPQHQKYLQEHPNCQHVKYFCHPRLTPVRT